jgi:hypothetical protein
MPDQIYIGNFAKGLTTSRLPFVIDNDAFPTMYNFYSWRGRAKRKRGTIFLGQLQIQEQISATPNNWQLAQFALVAGAGNLIVQYSLGSSASIVPGSLSLVVGANTYTDTHMDGTLQGAPAGSGTINYATGAFTISGGGASDVTGTFSYFPGNPVMGLRDYAYNSVSGQVPVRALYPKLVAFDTTNAYQIIQTSGGQSFYNVSFYKGTNNPVVWDGEDFQQFWTTNYQGALWATNNVPGLHFVNGTYTSGSGTALITFNFKSVGSNYTTLIVGDKLWFNEWNTVGSTINGLVGTVSTATDAANGNYVVTFTGNQTVAGVGIAQLLSSSIAGQDGIRWYDGDPTSATGLPTGTGLGWVNFAPPLTAATVSIDDETAALYYLVGALLIVPFKDRLLFLSPWIQTSSGVPIQLSDVVLWSWNGTPYYANLTPTGETNNVKAYYQDQTGLGGNLPLGTGQPITTVSNNEDVLLIGFGGSGRKTRFVYTSNDLQPFLFYNINSELPSDSTFSAITLDKGALDIGAYGIAMTDQQSSQRIDLDIPDSVFQIQALNNGALRVNAVRDFYREWVYFAYPLNNIPPYGDNSICKFPKQTFLFNYRDNTWGVQYENFTAHGTFRPTIKKSWLTLGFESWNSWREPWNSGANSPQFPSIVAGNPQGYVLTKGQGTGEGISGTVQAVTASASGEMQITSINHCVQTGDYLYFSGFIGLLSSTITGVTLGFPTIVTTMNSFVAGDIVNIAGIVGTTELNQNDLLVISASGTEITLDIDSSAFTPYVSGGTATSDINTIDGINTIIGKVVSTANANTFVVDIPAPVFASTYIGLGKYTRLSQPLLQTKQFPVYWDQGRQTRLSTQKYLMDYTANSQVTVNVYLSQDPDDVWNTPQPLNKTSALVYSQLMYTCPESTNIGLTPANSNLQMPTAEGQYQIWHRFNTSLIGDSVQIGITLSDAQMRNLTYATSEITLQGMHLVVDRGPQLA